jgi:hypothetical protein
MLGVSKINSGIPSDRITIVRGGGGFIVNQGI